MKTQIELKNEFAQIDKATSLILKNIRDCIDREEAILEKLESVLDTVKTETDRGIAANAKGFEKVGGIFKYLSDAQHNALKAKIEEMQKSPNPYLSKLPLEKADIVLGWCALYQHNDNNLRLTARQAGARVSTVRDNLIKMRVYKPAAKSGNKGGHKQLSKKHNLSRREQDRESETRRTTSDAF